MMALSASMLFACTVHTEILGPRDKPDPTATKWTSMDVRYYIRVGKDKLKERKLFTITNSDTLAGLRFNFDVKEVSGLSIGCNRRIAFTTQDGEEWYGSFCFADKVYMCKKSRVGSYAFTLNNNQFYDTLAELCAERERAVNPDVEAKHILLLSGHMHYAEIYDGELKFLED